CGCWIDPDEGMALAASPLQLAVEPAGLWPSPPGLPLRALGGAARLAARSSDRDGVAALLAVRPRRWQRRAGALRTRPRRAATLLAAVARRFSAVLAHRGCVGTVAGRPATKPVGLDALFDPGLYLCRLSVRRLR